MRSTLLFGARVVVGGYLAVHGAQKLFGAFGGPGLGKAAAGFERIGLAPGRQMAALAGAAELGGGLLTVAGAADPAGPLAIIGTMAVASATHRANGPLARDGGFELPLTNLAAAAALAAAGPGRFRLGPALPRPLAAAVGASGGLLAVGSIAKIAKAARAARATPASTPAAEADDNARASRP
ncbi:MAG TPA: DoxX family membrane protein, partial [Streptosporangiaceae bacterium]|nr:DoxX family membrane protein [Streptosporangiaceae bacterium]